MNTDNNLETNVGSESFGAVNTPVQPINPEPLNQASEETFSPFQDLNNETLNVPSDAPAAPVNDFAQAPQVDNTFTQASAPVQNVAPSIEQPVQAPVDYSQSTPASYSQPAPSVEPYTSASVQPEVQNDATIAFDTTQTAPTMDTPVQSVPTFDQGVTAPVDAPQVDNTFAQVNEAVPVQTEPVMEAPVEQGPTLPIPDQMPANDYQAGVSTPVDYATPMSDFDQIGTTPELDPKAKGNKKKSKGLTVILLLLVIAALGGGAYYLINIKGILNKDHVTVKAVKSEKGESLSVNIDDYATFENTSSSNCVLDTTEVDTSKTGTYNFKITCGDKTYTGNIEIVDTKAPEISVKTNVIIAGTNLLADALATSSEEATYSYTNDAEVQTAYSTAGLKIIDLNVIDAGGNSKTYKVPVIVTSSEYNFILSFKKDVNGDDTNATILEKNVILFSQSPALVNDTSYTAYIIKFGDKAKYNEVVKSYDDSGSLTYGAYSGTPLFYADSNMIVLVRDINSDFLKSSYTETMGYINSLGTYQVETGSPTNRSTIKDFNEV